MTCEEELYKNLITTIEKLIINGINRFIIGSHGMFDKLALSACRKLKNKYKSIKICVVLTQLSILKKTDYGKYLTEIYKDVEIIIYNIEQVYYKKQITVSNQYMIDESDFVVCFVDCNKKYGGAIQSYKYCLKSEKQFVNLYNRDSLNYV